MMRMRRLAFAVLAGTALTASLVALGPALAEDVSVNLDALGPEPKKTPPKPSKPVSPNAVRSDIVPDPVPPQTETPKPKPALKPAASAGDLSKPSAAKTRTPSGEIDFIGKTKKAQGVAGEQTEQSADAPVVMPPVTQQTQETKPAGAPRPPVMATPIPDDPAPAPVAAAPVTPAPVSPALTPVPPAAKAAAKPKPTPATVQVNTSALTGDPESPGQPQGTPLTSVAPDGVLFIPKNVDALPQPVSVPQQAAPVESEEVDKPLTVPPSLPEVPQQSAPKPAATPQPSANLAPPSTQTVAAATPNAAPKPSPAGARASALAGYATAVELVFEPGQDALTSETKVALDQIAEPLKSAGLRVQLAAYSGPPGNNASDSRRLSLKRALAVRSYLGGHGIAKVSVNIAAFGGAAQGHTDRVDVMVNTDQVGRLTGQQ